MQRPIKGKTGVGHAEAGLLLFRRFRWVALFFAVAGFSFDAGAQLKGRGTSEEYLNRLEWRGILVLPGEVQISLHDGSDSGFWIRSGQVRNGVEVVEYDQKENEVVLRHGEATRSISLSDSTVRALEGDGSSRPPPLVTVGGSANKGQENPNVPAPDGARSAQLWGQALEGSDQLREIDQQFRRINEEEARVAEAMSGLDPDDRNYATIQTRHKEIQEERRLLTEGALTELRNTSALRGQAAKEMEQSLRGGFSLQIAAPEQPDAPEPPESGESNGRPEQSRDDG